MLNTVPDDNLTSILYYLENNDILIINRICKRFAIYFKSQTLVQILSAKLNMKNATLNQLLLRCHRNAIITVITILAQYYIAGGGLSLINIKPLILDRNNSKLTDKYLDLAFDNQLMVRKFYSMSDIEKAEEINYRSQINNYDKYLIYFTSDYFTKQMQRHVHFKEVIIRRNTDSFKPIYEWYNTPNNRLPCLNTRNYIIVNDPFGEVTISAKIKGSF